MGFFTEIRYPSMPSVPSNDLGVGVVATPDKVWHRDSQYWRKFIGGTQDTDFNKGIIGRMFTKFLRLRSLLRKFAENNE